MNTVTESIPLERALAAYEKAKATLDEVAERQAQLQTAVDAAKLSGRSDDAFLGAYQKDKAKLELIPAERQRAQDALKEEIENLRCVLAESAREAGRAAGDRRNAAVQKVRLWFDSMISDGFFREQLTRETIAHVDEIRAVDAQTTRLSRLTINQPISLEGLLSVALELVGMIKGAAVVLVAGLALLFFGFSANAQPKYFPNWYSSFQTTLTNGQTLTLSPGQFWTQLRGGPQFGPGLGVCLAVQCTNSSLSTNITAVFQVSVNADPYVSSSYWVWTTTSPLSLTQPLAGTNFSMGFLNFTNLSGAAGVELFSLSNPVTNSVAVKVWLSTSNE